MFFLKIFTLLVGLNLIFYPLRGEELIQPTLILNMENTKILPPKFRTSKDSIKLDTLQNAPSLKGLNTLNVSGSAQFSKLSLKKLLETLNSKWPVYDIDLRQEFHGFLNGAAISWYMPKDWINKGKTGEVIARQEKRILAELLQKESISLTIIKSKTAEGGIDTSTNVTMPVKDVSNEQDIAAENGINYLRIYVTDHLAPSDEDVDQFIEFIKQLPQGRWLHFHCAAGDGRTTTFLAMIDMMYNAKDISFEDILKRQFLIGGIDLTNLGDFDSWKHYYLQERLEFLKKFYDYCKKSEGNFVTPWNKLAN